MSARAQSALLGGLFIGVLSSLPLVNLCCCLWVVSGGMLVTYLRQQKLAEPIETSEAVLVGLLAGAVGAVLFVLSQALLAAATGDLWQEQVRSQLESNPDIPQQFRDTAIAMIASPWFAVIQFGIVLPIYALLSMLGSLLGVAFFRKKTPPSA